RTAAGRVSECPARVGGRPVTLRFTPVHDSAHVVSALLAEQTDLAEVQAAQARRWFEVLRDLSSGAPLPSVLTALVLAIEEAAPGMIGSILLLDPRER